MKSGRYFLLLFLLPVALVMLLTVPITFWNLGTIREQHGADQQAEAAILNLLAESAAIDEAGADIHRRTATGLEQAAVGTLDEAGMYRLHTEVVDGLAAVTRRVEGVVRAPQVLAAAPDEVQRIAEQFAAYRNFIVMATDIAAIDPSQANAYIRSAQDAFIAFSGLKSALTAKLVAYAGRHQLATKHSFDAVLARTVLIGAAGLSLMLLLAFLASRWISRQFVAVTDALLDLAQDQENSPELPEIERMYFHGKGAFRDMAQAVLAFRNAIVERQHAEDELRKLTLAVEQNPHSVVITDTSGTIEFVNQSFIDATGYLSSEVIGQNPRMLGSDQTPRSVYEDLWATLTAGKPWRGELINRRKNGEKYVELVLIAPVRQPDGRVTHYLAIKEDITAQKRLEAELEDYRLHLEQQVNERTRQLQLANERLGETEFAMDRSGIAIHWVDAVDGRFLDVNAHACDLLGYTREEMLGMAVPDIDPNFPKGAFGNATQPLRDSGTGRLESTQISKDGRELPVEITYYYQPPTDQRGGRFIAFLTDISQRKEIERALAAAKEAAEAANRAKGEFLANMSHEIRTPMNAVIGLTHLCLRTELDAKQRDYLDKVARAAGSLLGIINDILDFSKIDAGKLEMEAIPFAVADVLANLTALFDVKARQKGLAFHVVVAPELPAILLGDPLRLGQVLLNLVGNAVKFTERGEIWVGVEVAETTADEVALRFAVRDTGIGMNDQQIGQLFQPFTQADASITRKFGGTGLGLSISRRLVKMMGGEIRIDSVSGAGTEFSFTARFGKASGALATLRHPIEQAHTLGGAHLLLVEDNEINRQVARELLAQAGITVTEAENGQEALECIDREAFDGVLMDLQMPVMDGITASTEIRRQERFKDLPIIAMTANAMAGDQEKCLAAGMNDHIAKPIDPDRMFATLAKWIVPANPVGVPASTIAVSPEPTFAQALPVIPGLNVAASVRRIGGSVANYTALLMKFRHNQAHVVADIDAALARGERDTAQRLAHTLKGLCGSIGAEALQSQAAELELYLQEGAEAIQPQLLSIGAALDALFDHIDQTIAAPDAAGAATRPAAAGTPDAAALSPLFAKARLQLDRFDADIEQTVTAIRQCVGDDMGAQEALATLARCLDAYDYEQALLVLNDWAGQFDIQHPPGGTTA